MILHASKRSGGAELGRHLTNDRDNEHVEIHDGRKAVGMWEPALDEQMAKQTLDRQAVINSLGNLTLLTGARNISLSNRPFIEKRSEFEKSLLVLNRDIARETEWTEELISARSRKLAEQALRLWPEPPRATSSFQAA